VGGGTGRESADIHFWLTDEQGKKVFDQKDTIKAEFWGNAYAGSVGQLGHPFARKIAPAPGRCEALSGSMILEKFFGPCQQTLLTCKELPRLSGSLSLRAN
jgi:hypothetical protein